jgi:hypothetical protein
MLGTEQPTLDSVPLPLHIYIVSNTPGRLRFRVAREHRQPATLATIADTLKSFADQVHTVRATVSTGSITLYYSGDAVDFNETMAALQQFGMVVVDVPSGRSQASTQVTNTLARANQWLAFQTEGTMDLRVLVPLIFAFLALRQLTKSPGLNTAPWYVLAWYAFDSFCKLNQEIPAAAGALMHHKGI